MAKTVAKAPATTQADASPKKKLRQVPPPPSNRKQFDPKEYDLDEEPVAAEPSTSPPEASGGESLPSPEPPPADAPPRDEAGRFTPAPKPAHSPRLVRMATELGITQADLEGLTSEQLYDEILLQQRQIMAWQDQERRQAPRGPLVNDPVAPPQEEDDLGLHQDTDPGIAAALKRLAKENKELKKSLADSGEREQVRERETRNERIDRTFAGLNEYQVIFGKGQLGELTAEELACRQAVLVRAGADQSKAPLDAKIIKAVKTLYRHHVAPPAPPAAAPVEPAYEQPAPKPSNGVDYESEELAKRRQVWNASTLAEPTARKGAEEPKSLAKAKSTYLKGLKDNGLDPTVLAVEETADLPD